jgi:hypothetical protein
MPILSLRIRSVQGPKYNEPNNDQFPKFVVWAGPLKSLRSVTVRKPRLLEIGVIRRLLNGLRYRKNERLSHVLPPG